MYYRFLELMSCDVHKNKLTDRSDGVSMILHKVWEHHDVNSDYCFQSIL